MLVCVTIDSIHKYGAAFRAQYKLRHKVFIERENYQVPAYNNMEYDQYDTPAAMYLVYLAPNGDAWGCARLTPTAQGSMLKDIWPELVQNPDRVFQQNVLEGTRFCIEKSLPAEMRRKICQELVIGYLEVGLAFGYEKIIGVMHPYIFRKVFGDCGINYSFLGGKIKLPSGDMIAAGEMEITHEVLEKARLTTGIHSQLLMLADELPKFSNQIAA